MIIKREQYIEALLNKRWNGKVKIITGIPFLLGESSLGF
ncbi:ATPase [Segatella baroniae B14]|jgi:hypothetical protein|uniref:ATPase n=1 Tax=Segatella baroniae B14 TaxID=752555 RepID=D8DUL7_9BACT|nr:ATPase [Segatella baroniae B14]